MKVNFDKRIDKFSKSLSKSQKAKVIEVIDLFKEKGFLLSEKHLKKISKQIWELRPGNVRLLFGIANNEAIVVNAFTKKTNKTPLKEIKLSKQRLGEYL